MIRISHTSIHVDDQARAHRFYTEVLGFETKHDIDMGGPRWLTLVSPGAPDGPELVLEPDDHPAAKAYKEALVADGIPITMFTVDDVTAEHQRLADLGVRFTQEPLDTGQVMTAVLDDTCGNLVQIAGPAAG